MMETLLTEIVSNIFSRLPFDKVMQCRCVSKSWYNLLQLLIHTSGDLYFAKTHRSRLLQNHHHHHHLNSYSSSPPDSILLLLDQSVVDNYGQLCFGEYYNRIENGYNGNKQLVVKKFNSPVLLNMSSKFWTTASSSNGLICSAFHDHQSDDDDSSYLFYIYNPFLREYVTLPKLKSAESNSMAFGFGYVPSTDEYKVVRIFYPGAGGGGDDNSTVGNVEVYTLGKMSHIWRSKGSIQHRLKVSSPGVLVNGSVLHWLTEKVLLPDDDQKVKQLDILAFDLLEEEFRSVPLPPTKHLINFQIKELGGCLCAINDGGERIMEMWIMENYHTKESSWKRAFWIQWGGGQTEQCFYWNKVDQALLWSNSSLICVDVDKLLGPKIAGKGPISIRLFHGIPHIKSFVSLKALGEDDAITIRLDNNDRKRKCYFDNDNKNEHKKSKENEIWIL